MIKNYLKTALRNILKYKSHSILNILGLSIGLTCTILIFMWVQDELSYDKFHENADELFLVVSKVNFSGETSYWISTPPALGPALKAEYPEVVNSVRIPGYFPAVLSYKEKKFDEKIRAVDASLLEMMTFPLKQGDPATALSGPRSIVISEKMAEKYFGDEKPVGKIIRVENKYNFTVTGVMETIPNQSYLNFDFLVPIEFFTEFDKSLKDLNIWTRFDFKTIIQLEKNTSYKAVGAKISERVNRGRGEDFAELFLRPYTSLHLYNLGYGGGTIKQVRVFTLIAFLVLLIACINFMNLSTTRSENRAKEIGIRKVVGAYKEDVIKQFYGESILLTFISLVFAIILVKLLLPVFNDLSGKELTLDFAGNYSLIPVLIGVTILTGIIAGSYPALFMSSFQPVTILKGFFRSGGKGSNFRKMFVVIQFTISIVLIISTIVINNQFKYILNKNLGFDKEHLLYIWTRGELERHYQAARQDMLQNPNILNVAMTSHSPTGIYSNGSNWQWEAKHPETDPQVTNFWTDDHLLSTFKMKMADGKFFSGESFERQGNNQVVINETFANIMNMQNPIGARLSHGSNNYVIKGIIEDFNFKPLDREIEPLIIYNNPGRYRFMFLRIAPDNIARTIEYIKNVYNKFNPEYAFTYHFFDEDYDSIYKNVQQTGSVLKYFTGLAIFICCLGLFGLVSFVAEKRTKEIGIRKALGASTLEIVLLLLKDFIKLVLLANLIACPVAYYFTSNWLKDYAYRINIGWGVFVFAAILAMIITILTVGFKTVRAALANPTTSLRYE